MRPLAIFVLVAGAIAALVFAFLQVQESDNKGGSSNAVSSNIPGEVIAAEHQPDTLSLPSAGPANPAGMEELSGHEEVDLPLDAVNEDRNDSAVATVADPVDTPQESGVQVSVLDDGIVLFGRVVAAGTQSPISGAVMLLENPAAAYIPRLKKNMKPREAVTDENGYYEMRNVTPNGKLLACSAKGYATQLNQRDTSIVGSKEQRKQIDFELEEGLVIAGTIIGPDGKGVESLRINAFGRNARSGSRGTGVSGEGGEFLVSDVADARYTLRFEADGLARRNLHSDQHQVSAGDRNVEIQLQAQGGLIGIVVNNDGPQTRFTITVRRSHTTNRAFGQIIKKQKFKSTNGEYQIDDLDQGDYTVQADADGYASSFSELVSIKQGQVGLDVEVRMTEGGSISGQVRDSYTNEPVAGARVRTLDNNHISSGGFGYARCMAPTALTKTNSVTDSEGRFELPLLLPDTYQVRIEHSDRVEVISNDVQVVEGGGTDMGIIKLMKGGSIRGTAFSTDGPPGPDILVHVYPGSGSWDGNFRTLTDADGNYLVQNIPPGTYTVTGSRSLRPTESAFIRIKEIKNSKVEVSLADGEELALDLYLGGR